MPRIARTVRDLASFAPLLTLVGCATTAGSASYETLQHDYERSSTRSAPRDHVSTLHDEVPSLGAPVLDRVAYIRAVLDRNPTIESSRRAWGAAIARVRQAGPLDDPMVELGAAPLSVASGSTRLGYQVGISQKLPWFGKQSLEASVATAEAEAKKSDYQSTQRDLALTALILYDQYFIAERSLEINAHHVELMRVMRAATAAQLETGRGSAEDVLRAEGELAHMEHDTVILRSQRQVAIAQMNELLHRAPELPLPPPARELSLSAEPDADAHRLETEALAGRTEIAAARQRARAEQARGDRADREYYPDFTLSTSYNSMWDMPEHRWMVGLAFNLPLQTGRRAGMADEARAARAELENDAERLTDAARTQVFVALERTHNARRLLGLFETRLLPIARDRVGAARAGFVASQSPFGAVIDADKNLRGVELDYQMARADCDRNQAELDRALGRIPGLDAKLGAKLDGKLDATRDGKDVAR